MKKLLPIIFILLFILIIVAIFLNLAKEQEMVTMKEGNLKQIPLEVVLGKYQDSDCGMIIDDLKFASQIAYKDGKTWFFHEHGGMANWLIHKDKAFIDNSKIWVMTLDTKRYVEAQKAFFTTNEETPMNYGFGAYENPKDGSISFEEMLLRVSNKHKQH